MSDADQIEHQFDDAEYHQNERYGEADAQKNEMAGFTVAEVSFSIFPALHAQSAG